jgi:hypothetical protein
METRVIYRITLILLFVITGIFSNHIYAKHDYSIDDLSVTYDHYINLKISCATTMYQTEIYRGWISLVIVPYVTEAYSDTLG